MFEIPMPGMGGFTGYDGIHLFGRNSIIPGETLQASALMSGRGHFYFIGER